MIKNFTYGDWVDNPEILVQKSHSASLIYGRSSSLKVSSSSNFDPAAALGTAFGSAAALRIERGRSFAKLIVFDSHNYSKKLDGSACLKAVSARGLMDEMASRSKTSTAMHRL